MKKGNEKRINGVVYNTTLDSDISVTLIDKTLIDSHSIMYTRQATYLYLLKLTGVDVSLLRKQVKHRAKLTGVELSRGVLNKESDVANLCLTDKSIFFKDVDFSKENPAKSIKEIANIMVNNKISYTYLKKEGYFTKEETQDSAGVTESSQDTDSTESITSFAAVVKFIQSTTQENRLKLADILASAITQNAGESEEEEEKAM